MKENLKETCTLRLNNYALLKKGPLCNNLWQNLSLGPAPRALTARPQTHFSCILNPFVQDLETELQEPLKGHVSGGRDVSLALKCRNPSTREPKARIPLPSFSLALSQSLNSESPIVSNIHFPLKKTPDLFRDPRHRCILDEFKHSCIFMFIFNLGIFLCGLSMNVCQCRMSVNGAKLLFGGHRKPHNTAARLYTHN